eukprot:8485822-Lingulodinium_polyedra.AAC.1
MAMGDHNAAGCCQCARLGLGVRSATVEDAELLALRRCPPRAAWVAGIIFDDSVGVAIEQAAPGALGAP